MYPSSIYFGLKVIPVEVLRGQGIFILFGYVGPSGFALRQAPASSLIEAFVPKRPARPTRCRYMSLSSARKFRLYTLGCIPKGPLKELSLIHKGPLKELVIVCLGFGQQLCRLVFGTANDCQVIFGPSRYDSRVWGKLLDRPRYMAAY